MKQVVTLLLALLCFERSMGQQKTLVTVIVVDSSRNEKMINANILLMRATDSIIITTGRTNDQGLFRFSTLTPGAYILTAMYPGYTDGAEKIRIAVNDTTRNFFIALFPKVHTLDDVIVKNEIIKIRIKGDTIEYRADSFLTDKNASVEDLLKKLPGITIDANGRISAHGKPVEKIMIGGEEYFSEDPSLVTRSLRSNIVQKVQVFDKYSDQASFTKIKDGKSTKAINLELKPDKKKGYFGKLEGGTNWGSFYNNLLMVNRFNGEEKIAGYIINSSLGKTGLSWQDTRTYSDFALTAQQSSGFATTQTSALDNWDGTYQNQGLPNATAVGMLYANKLGNNLAVNGNGRYYRIGVDMNAVTSQQYSVNDTRYSRLQSTASNNTANQVRGIVKATIRFSANSDIIVGIDLDRANKHIYNNYSSSLFQDTVYKINTQLRRITATGTDNNANISLLWRRKFTSGSTFSLNAKIFSAKNNFSGFIKSTDSLFAFGAFKKDSITDQLKADDFASTTYHVKAVLTLPVNVFSTLSFNSAFTNNSTNNNISSFNRTPAGAYTSIDSIYSSGYEITGNNQTVGVGFNFSKGKVLLNMLVDAGVSIISQQERDKGAFEKKYPLLFPTATLTYSFNRQHKIVADYTGSTIVPQLRQLQPVLSNIDPLNVNTGNPALRAAFRNSLNIQYYNFNSSKDISVSGGGVYSFDMDGFSTTEQIDSLGKRQYAVVNQNGLKRINFFGYFTFKPFHKLIDCRISVNMNGLENTKFINGSAVLTKSFDYGLTIAPSYYRQDKVTVELNAGYRWTTISSYAPSLSKSFYQVFTLQPLVSVNLSKAAVLKSDYYLTAYPGSKVYGSSQQVSILNASITQQLLKSKAAAIEFSAHDIFNSNRGIQRSVTENFITQTNYNTIGRYFMITIRYFFSKTSNPT